jgi:hypothetical protein
MNVNLAECTAVKQSRYTVYVCVNDITTGQLTARQDNTKIRHEPFQALRRLLNKFTDENRGKPTENLSIFLGKICTWTLPNITEVLYRN